jgi:hypothetical protein
MSRTAASVHIVAQARVHVLRNSQRSHRKDRDRSTEKHGCRGVRASHRASSTKQAVCVCVQVRMHGVLVQSLIKVWRKQTMGRVTLQLYAAGGPPTTMRPTDSLRPSGCSCVARSRNVRDPRLWVLEVFLKHGL